MRHVILQGASIAALRDDMPEVALHLQQAALDNAYQWGRPPAVITGHFTRAEIYSRLSQPQGVALDLLEAHRYARNIQDPLLVARNEARILLARGETAARERPDEAIETLSSALSYSSAPVQAGRWRVSISRAAGHSSRRIAISSPNRISFRASRCSSECDPR